MWIVVCCGGSRLDQNPGCCDHQHEGQPSELISHDVPSRMCAGRGALPGPSLTPAGEVSRQSGAPGRNRTCCLSVRSRTLCPVSYRRVAGFPVYLPRYTAPSVNRLTAAMAITFALVACTSPLTSAPPPSPLPSPTPHNPVASTLLQPSDLPAPLSQCPGSGAIAR